MNAARPLASYSWWAEVPDSVGSRHGSVFDH